MYTSVGTRYLPTMKLKEKIFRIKASSKSDIMRIPNNLFSTPLGYPYRSIQTETHTWTPSTNTSSNRSTTSSLS